MKIPRAAAKAVEAALAEGRATAGPTAKVGGPVEVPGVLVLDIPNLRVCSEQNQREHWAVRDQRRKAQQLAVDAAMIAAGDGPRALLSAAGLTVRFHRRGPGLLDDDNLTGAFKHCRDRVAFWMYADDADPWFTWVIPPTQERSREYGVTITLEPREGV